MRPPVSQSTHLALAPVHPFVGVEPALLVQARRQLDALRVDQCQRGRRQPASSEPVGAVAGLAQALERAVGAPLGEVVIHGGPGRKARRQAAPLATGAADIAHDIKGLAQAVAAFVLRRQQRGNDLPLRVSKGLMSVNHKASRSLGTPLSAYWLVFFLATQFPNTLLDCTKDHISSAHSRKPAAGRVAGLTGGHWFTASIFFLAPP